ncbi:MucBP domain-containing protein [Streptococcus suis]|uniref:MucBP domain-containing protein n=5 Tax=Streptococcus suis TaxID=1307 RepID=UPI00378F3A2E
MHHSRRKSFDWYGLKQHFSIRKYHFGAASVLLGMSIALGTGTQVVQAAETVTTPESTSVASSTSATESTTSETSTETATSSSSERTVEIGYIVKYATEDDTLANASVETVSVTTTETIAKATVSVTAVVPEGYELASGQSATVSQEVTENGVNIVTVKVVKKAEEKAATSETTTTASTETATAKSTEASTTTATVSEAVKTPATVEEAKVVLEQVTSEAEVLANESERLVATSDKEDTALKAAAAATKLTATQATAVLKDSVATLEAVNAQINAVRTNVEALVLELRKYYPDGEITAVLDTATGTPAATTIETTNPASVSYAQHGVWEIPDPVKAANSGLTAAEREATITVAEKNYPAGYIGDQDANRDTFLIFNFDTVGGYGDGNNFNDWAKHNYYMTFSVSTDSTERAASDVVYAKLVEKTMNGDRVVKTVELKPNVKTVVDELNVLENYQAHRVKYDFTYIVSENGVTTRQISIYNSNGANWNTAVYNKLDQTRVNVNTNSFSTTVPSDTIQTTSYYVKENAATGRLRELLARHTQDSGLIGDAFHIAGAIDFDNYELIESELPKVESGILASDYKVGTQYAVFRGNWNEARLYTITDINGALQMQVYMLDPNNPDWANFYKTKMNNSGTVSDLDDYFTLMFTTEEMQPGGTYNTKPGTFTSKFYDANKLVLEGKQVQVLDSNGDVLGTLNDAQTSYTTATGQIVNVKSVTDTMVTDEDGTVHTVNTKKIYKTDAAGNYVDANGNVLTPIKWNVDAPYRNGKIADGYGTVGKFDTDSVTVSTGPLDAKNTNALWKFGWNYKTPDISDANVDRGGDDRWELGGLEMTLSNSNVKNEQNARYFYTEKGGVDVYYVDTEGNILKDMVTVVGHGDTGSEYNTAAVRDNSIVAADGTVYYYKEIDTTAKNLHPVVDDKTDTDYRSNEKIDAEKGTIKSDTVKQLTYVYEKAGNVNINYVDTEGTPLQASVADVTDGKPGSDYNTAQEGEKPEIIKTKDGKTYKLAPANTYNVGTVSDDSNLTAVGNGKAKGIDDVTGTVEAGVTKEITYVYKEVKGDVIVHYVDQDGKPISGTTDDGKQTASTVTDTPESSTGTPYDTTDLRPNTITTADGKIYKRVPAATIGKETGDVVEGTTEVTYVYELLQGDVIVHYVDTEGNTIADDVTDQVITDTGTDYDTKDNKPEKIVNDETGDVYYILPKDEVKAGDKETGKVVEGTTEVTYIYEKAGSVNVNYVDTEGNVLKAPVADVTDGKPGSAYDTVLDNKLASISVDGKLYRLVPAGTYNVGTVSNDNNLTAVGNGKATGIDATTGTVEAGKTKEITYVYEEVKGDVVVEYYDTEGNTIAKTEVDTPTTSVDTPYETYDHKPATITVVEKDGSETLYYYKEVKDTSAPEKGDVVEGTTTVQYVYEKAGNVNVNYVDTEGNVIQAPVADVTDGKPDSAYATTDHKPEEITTADGKTYRLVAKEKAGDYPVGTVSDEGNLTAVGNGTAIGVDSETGTVEAGKTKEITYVYEEVKGDVIVHYVDTEGNPISGTTDEGKKTASTVTDTPESSTGTPYDTTDLRPNTITTADGKIYKRVPAATIGKEDGEVVEGTTEVTYVYELLQGDVIVHYVDTEGNTIADDVTDQTITDTGKDYDTRDNKPEKIVDDKTGDVYYILPKDEVKAGDKETGKVVEGTTEVTYIYQKAGSVNVNYVDTEGNVLKDPVADVTDGKPGSGYDTVLDNKLASISVDGKLYRLAPANTYNVGTVSDDNNLTAAGNGKATGIDATTGTVEAGTTKEITYVYQEVKGDVVVEYYDTEGNQIAKTVVDEDDKSVGTVYNTDEDNKPETITTEDGTVYYYKEVKDTSAPTTGKVVEGTTTVQYVYEKAGSVNVNYVDTDGNPIQAPVADETNEKAGTEYATADNKPSTITTADGKTYRLVEAGTYNVGTVSDDNNLTAVGNGKATGIDATTGTVEAGTTKEITYVYEEVKGNVVVNYITTDGTVIKQPVEDTPTSSTGTPYDTTDNKPTTITTEDGKTYRIVPVLTKGSETGKVVEGTTSITYVYEEVKGDVVVEYYDTEGNLISGLSDSGEAVDTKEVDTPSTSTGTAYNTDEDHKPNTITTADGTVYYYKEVKDTSASTTGKVVEGTTTVQYVYEKAGNVIVHYITEDGTVIKATVTDEENAKPGKSYDTTDNKPVEIVTEDGSRYVLIPSKTIGTENGTVEGGKTIEITYVYKKVANWIPQIPGVPAGEEPKVPYPFDPTNPDKPIDPTTPGTNGEVPSIPHVPGYTPVDPKTNEPLKPVDPTDPGKGYVPPTPDDSGVDTPVPYVQNGNVVVNYVDENGNVLKTPVNDETDAPAGKSYDTTDNKPTTITTEDGSRYVLIPSKTIGTENGTVEGGKTIEITYVYKKVANWIPQIPGVPAGEEPKVPYPFDPTNPDVPVTPTPDTVIPNVPGYTPVDPKTNEPLKPVDPTDPGKGYVPPTPDDSGVDTPVPYVQNGNVVVNYVDENGNVLKTPVNDETDAPAGKSYDTTDNKPVEIVTEDGSRYVLIPSKTIGTENGTVEGGKTIEITYVYKKVANWIPQIPGVPAGEEPKVPYPFDPTNPDVPVTPTPDTVIPNVPGYTPVDPKTNEPLKPVDPTDPGKGYVPPTPDDSGVDTPVPYVQNGNVVVNYVDENGNVLKTPVNDETDAPAGKSYDTTDNKPNTITTEDGTTYELVRVEGSETGTVVGGKTTEVTYVYRKVETPAKKVVTNHVDEDGNPIAPQEEGTTPNKSIPGYEFTGKTVTDPDGNTTHIYRKVTKVVTNHVDEDGNPIAPQEEGTTPNKSIPGYEFTGKTVTDPDGNTTHIYRKVSKPVAPKPQAPVAPTTAKAGAAQLPNTGEASSSATVLGAGMLIAALALAGKRRRNED